MQIYGTTTSPFVRRLRVVAAEVGEPIERIDTATDEGQAALRAVSPIGKVPVAIVDGRTLYDSRVIIDWLVTTRGWHDLAPPRDRWHEQNLLNAADVALESIIPVFLLRRDGTPIDDTAYAKRQIERVDAIFAWLAPQLRGDALGLPEITVIAALDWMEFRKTYDVTRAPAVACERVRAAWRERPSLVSTRPHA